MPSSKTAFIIFLGLVAMLVGRWIGTTKAKSQFHSPIIIEGRVDPIYFSLTPFPATPTPTYPPDTILPRTSFIPARQPNTQGWYNEIVTGELRAVDEGFIGPDSILYRLNRRDDFTWGGDLVNGYDERVLPITVTVEGAHQLEYYAIDKAGRPGLPHTLPIRLDLTPPTVTHTLAAGGQSPQGRYTLPVTVTLRGEDHLSGLDFYRVNLNGRGWLTVTTTYVVTTAGSHVLSYQAVDRAGNVSPVVTTTFVSGEVEGNYLPFIFK